MELNALTAISPIDGRYRKQVQHLDDYFSEFALIKYRVLVEVEYLRFLADKKFFSLPAAAQKVLRETTENFSVEDAQKIKDTDKITNHDVKAVEYFVKRKTGGCQSRRYQRMGAFWIDITRREQYSCPTFMETCRGS
jgi:adenylosuccinate lyase